MRFGYGFGLVMLSCFCLVVNLVGFFGRCVVLRANLFCEGVVELFFFCRVFFVFFVNSLLFLPWAGGLRGVR